MFDHGGLSVAVGHVCIQKGSKKLGCDDGIDGRRGSGVFNTPSMLFKQVGDNGV